MRLSISECQRLTELEERYWGEKALKALESGVLSEGETSAWMNKKLAKRNDDEIYEL